MSPDRAISGIPSSRAGEGRGIRIALILTAAVTSLVSLVAPVAGIVALVALAFAAVLVWSFPAAMLAYVFLEQTLANVFLIKTELFGLLLASWAVWYFSGRRARVQSFDSVDWAVLLYGIWCLISLLRCIDLGLGFEQWSSITLGLVFFFLVSRNLPGPRYGFAVLGTIAAAGLTMAAFGYYQFMTGASFVNTLGSQANIASVDRYPIGTMIEVNRVNSTTFDPQDYALYMQTAILCATGLLVASRRWLHRILLLVAVVALTGAWMLAFSRRSIICLGLAFVLLVSRKPKLLGLVLIAAAVTLGIGWVRSGFVQRLVEISVVWGGDAAPIDTAVHAYRVAESKHAWEVFLESPLFGKGMANYGFHAVSSQASFLSSSRDFNGILLHLAEHGLVPSLLLAWIFGATVTRGFFLSRRLGKQDERTFGWLVYATTVALIGLLASAFISEQAYYFFVVWVLAGSIHGMRALADEWRGSARQSGERPASV